MYYVLLFFTNMLVGWLGGFLERVSGTQFWLLHAVVVFSAALILLAVRNTAKRLLAPVAEAIPTLGATGTPDALSTP
jgi:POT family proton-dependent oligopeptide transporter